MTVSVAHRGIVLIRRGPSSADGSILSASLTMTNVLVLIFPRNPAALITALPLMRVSGTQLHYGNQHKTMMLLATILNRYAKTDAAPLSVRAHGYTMYRESILR